MKEETYFSVLLKNIVSTIEKLNENRVLYFYIEMSIIKQQFHGLLRNYLILGY